MMVDQETHSRSCLRASESPGASVQNHRLKITLCPFFFVHSVERRKCLESQRSGAGSDDITEPSLWYHNLIGYVFDNSEERGAFDSLESEDVQEQDITLMMRMP
ncbi:unnamed protein product [Acanthoscelides obtectus]|uniref:Uncharacterized protein n=1 Tax=Acanthoscelides obtectus TaxID=200917 RepID=A0A9P0JSU6_ACAOB|nr:unnamed protein product [Acanthoscelides obtectus]CAK1634002.1 hypothetical protein AOBTE_LOCUS8529 [Acanthoscelides obtectus]